MLRTTPRTTEPSLRDQFLPLLAAPDVTGANAAAAGFGGLLVVTTLWIASAPAFLVGCIGAITLVLLVAGVALPLLATLYESS